MAAAVAEPGLDSGITTSAWHSYIENVQPDDDDDSDSDDEEEICNIFGGPPEPERDAIAMRREWMAVVQQRLEASVEPIYPRVKLAPNESAAAPMLKGVLPRPVTVSMRSVPPVIILCQDANASFCALSQDSNASALPL